VVGEWIMVGLTLVIAFFTFLVWKSYYRIEWFTGAMETHSNVMLQIEARRGINGEPIKLVYWDPTIEKFPKKEQQKDGQEVDLSVLYIGLPIEMRRNKPTAREILKDLISLP